MSLEIRQLPRKQLREYVEVVEHASGSELEEEVWPQVERLFEPERILGAYDGDRLVGGGAALSFRLTVPGGSVAAAAVTAVGVLPSHRRRGLLRQMMAAQLADVRRRGEPVAILWASEGSIYGRFGYGLGALNARIEIERERARLSDPVEPLGAMRMVDADEAGRLFALVYDPVCATTPGFFARSAEWWAADVLADPKAYRRGRAGRKFYVVNERAGRPRGYVIYRVAGEWGDAGSLSTLHVLELVARDADALREIWAFVFGHDLIHKIRARVGPADHPLLLQLAEPRRLGLRLGDGLWLRIVDVAAALAARSYAGSGRLVLQVTDTFLPAHAGRWALAVTDGRAEVGATDAPPDLLLDVTDLAAVYLGAFSFAQLALAGRTTELARGARERADALFVSHVRPWCPGVF